MTAFDGREKAFEDKYAHDEEMLFRAKARRNRLFGEWVAGELGLSGADVAEYAKAVVAADLEEAGDEDIFRKVEKDLAGAGVELSRHRLEKHLVECLIVAKEQVAREA